MRVLKERRNRVQYYEIPKEYIDLTLWMIAFNYKPGTIASTIRELKSIRTRPDSKTRNAHSIYNRYQIFKNEIGWEVDKNTAMDIRNKIKRLNFIYREKYGVEAILITQEELDKYLPI